MEYLIGIEFLVVEGSWSEMDFGVILVLLLMVSVIFLMRGRVVGEKTAQLMLRIEGCQVVDVRTLGEFEEHALEGTIHLPLNQLKESAEAVLMDKAAPILVFCQSGMRSGIGAKVLRQRGDKDVANLGSIQRAAKVLGRR